jgi:hypothetical protein
MHENADFSPETIRQVQPETIRQETIRQMKTNEILKGWPNR